MLEHKLDPGQMDRRVQLLVPSEAVDDTGGVVETFAVAATVFAKVEWDDGNSVEIVMAAKETARRVAVITIRFYPGLNERYRIAIDEEQYDITTIAEVGRKLYHEIKAERRL